MPARIEGNKLYNEYSAALASGGGPDDVVDPSDGETRLSKAARGNDVPTVKLLLAHRANPNKAQKHGLTALHWAAIRGDDAAVQALLAAGAAVNATTKGGGTPLYFADVYNRHSTVGILRSAGGTKYR